MTELDQYKSVLIRVIPLLKECDKTMNDLCKELAHVVDMGNQQVIMLSRECNILREIVAIQNEKDNPLHRRIGELTKQIRQLKSKKK
jgi:hypothetical protein